MRMEAWLPPKSGRWSVGRHLRGLVPHFGALPASWLSRVAPLSGRRRVALGAAITGALVGGLFLLDVAILRDGASVDAALLQRPSNSTTIALDNSETRVWAVNREANSVSVIRVRV